MGNGVIKIDASPYTTPSGLTKGKRVTYKQRLSEIDREKALSKMKTAIKKTFGHSDYRKKGLFR